MFKALKNWWLKDAEYRKALNNARHEERLKNVKIEAKIAERLRLQRKQNAVKAFSAGSKINISKVKSKSSSNAGSIMDLEI